MSDSEGGGEIRKIRKRKMRDGVMPGWIGHCERGQGG